MARLERLNSKRVVVVGYQLLCTSSSRNGMVKQLPGSNCQCVLISCRFVVENIGLLFLWRQCFGHWRLGFCHGSCWICGCIDGWILLPDWEVAGVVRGPRRGTDVPEFVSGRCRNNVAAVVDISCVLQV